MRGGGPNHHTPSENRVFSATEHQMNPGPVCKFEFYRCGSMEKKLERSICPGLVVVARQSRVGSKFLNLKISIFLYFDLNSFCTNYVRVAHLNLYKKSSLSRHMKLKH